MQRVGRIARMEDDLTGGEAASPRPLGQLRDVLIGNPAQQLELVVHRAANLPACAAAAPRVPPHALPEYGAAPHVDRYPRQEVEFGLLDEDDGPEVA